MVRLKDKTGKRVVRSMPDEGQEVLSEQLDEVIRLLKEIKEKLA